jgi:hypothetical protein
MPPRKAPQRKFNKKAKPQVKRAVRKPLRRTFSSTSELERKWNEESVFDNIDSG